MLSAQLHVESTAQLTPHMPRITLGGDGLAGFASIAPDQQIKLFFPRDGHPPTVPEPEPDGDVPTSQCTGCTAATRRRAARRCSSTPAARTGARLEGSS